MTREQQRHLWEAIQALEERIEVLENKRAVSP